MKAFHFYNEMDVFTYYQGKVFCGDLNNEHLVIFFKNS